METESSYIDSLLAECDQQTSQYTGKELDYATKALELSKALRYDIGIYESHFRIARSMMSNSNNEEAIEHLDVCYSIAQTLADTLRVARTSNSYGIAYYNLGITSKSLEHLLEALEISKSNQFDDIECRVYNNICSILNELGDYETSLEYLYNILAKCENTDTDLFPKCIVYRNLSHTLFKMDKISEAEYYVHLALDEALEQENVEILCESHYILGQIRMHQKQSALAEAFLLKSLALAERTSNDFYQVQVRIDLCKLYSEQNLLEKAFNTIQDAYRLAFQLDHPMLKRNTALTMADVCELTHNDAMLIGALKAFKDITHHLEEENLHRQQVFTKAQLMLFNLKKDNERLRVEIERDPLTGCLSSRTFPDRITQALSNYGNSGALIFLDIDNLKAVNDSYGHDAGDALLKSFAQDLMAVMPSESLKIRIAGDEFLVFMPRAGKADATNALDRLIKTLSVPRIIGQVRMPILSSAGIALYPEHSSDIINLRKMADAAMYSAKQAGRGIYRVYNAS